MHFIISLLSGSPLAYWTAGIVVLVLVVAAATPAFRFIGNSSPGGTRKRLELIETEKIDGKRRVVLLRRDDVEHLLLVGGRADLLIETRLDDVSRRLNRGPMRRRPEMAEARTEARPADRRPFVGPRGADRQLSSS